MSGKLFVRSVFCNKSANSAKENYGKSNSKDKMLPASVDNAFVK